MDKLNMIDAAIALLQSIKMTGRMDSAVSAQIAEKYGVNAPDLWNAVFEIVYMDGKKKQ